MNKKKRDTLYSIWSVFIAISVFLVFFSIIFATFSKDYSGVKKSTNTENNDLASNTDLGIQAIKTNALLAETADAGDSYTSKLTFLADNTLSSLKSSGLLSGNSNSSQYLSSSDGVISLSGISSVKLSIGENSTSISDAIAQVKPSVLIITIGENGAAYMGQSYFTSEYATLLNTIKSASPETVIICCSILPVSETYATSNNMNADTIKQANNWIQQTANDNDCKYADIYSSLCDDSGYLQEQYDSGDGLKVNSNAVIVMLNYLRTHAVL